MKSTLKRTRSPKSLVWYLPSLYGDIRLEQAGGKTTVKFLALNPKESEAMAKLRDEAVAKGWAEASGFDCLALAKAAAGAEPATEPAAEPKDYEIVLKAPIEEVQKCLAANMQVDRVLVTAVLLTSGELKEVKLGEPVPAKAKAAVTAAKPTRGCPAPNSDFVKHRATEVLRAFLTPQQCDDFDQYQQFVSVGADTGNRYMVTSRDAPDMLSDYGGRQLYDLDDKQAFCVHYDLTVPAAEEALALHLFLSLPGHEMYLREVDDDMAKHPTDWS